MAKPFFTKHSEIEEKTPKIDDALSSMTHFYFKPYSNVGDFAKNSVAPVVSPSVLALVAGVAFIAPVVTISVSLGAFLVAAAAFLNHKEQLAEDAFFVGIRFSVLSIMAASLGVICVILAPISIPICTTAIMTRTFASIFSLPSSLNDNSLTDQSSEQEESFGEWLSIKTFGVVGAPDSFGKWLYSIIDGLMELPDSFKGWLNSISVSSENSESFENSESSENSDSENSESSENSDSENSESSENSDSENSQLKKN